jgi:purine-cytosine permease-like protein
VVADIVDGSDIVLCTCNSVWPSEHPIKIGYLVVTLCCALVIAFGYPILHPFTDAVY